MVVIYTVGIPVLYAILLFRSRKVLMDGSARKEDAISRSFSNLWELCKPHRFYYELIECGRRILLAGMVVFILPNTVGQVAIDPVTATFAMVLSEIMGPYDSPWDAWVNRIGHVIIFSSMYLAFRLKIDLSIEREKSQGVFEALLVGAHMFMVLMATFEGAVLTLQWFKRMD